MDASMIVLIPIVFSTVLGCLIAWWTQQSDQIWLRQWRKEREEFMSRLEVKVSDEMERQLIKLQRLWNCNRSEAVRRCVQQIYQETRNDNRTDVGSDNQGSGEDEV